MSGLVRDPVDSLLLSIDGSRQAMGLNALMVLAENLFTTSTSEDGGQPCQFTVHANANAFAMKSSS